MRLPDDTSQTYISYQRKWVSFIPSSSTVILLDFLSILTPFFWFCFSDDFSLGIMIIDLFSSCFLFLQRSSEPRIIAKIVFDSICLSLLLLFVFHLTLFSLPLHEILLLSDSSHLCRIHHVISWVFSLRLLFESSFSPTWDERTVDKIYAWHAPGFNWLLLSR